MMHSLPIRPLILLFVFWLAIAAMAQPPGAEAGPQFGARVFSTFDEHSGQQIARIFLQTYNDNLTFLQSDSGYVAEIQVEVYLNKEEESLARSRSFRHKMLEKEFEATNDRKELRSFYVEMPVEVGTYQAAIGLTDKNTGLQSNRNLKFRVGEPDSSGLKVSDLLFFSKYRENQVGKIVDFIPHLTGNFDSEDQNLFFYFNTFSPNPNHAYLVKYRLKDENGKLALENSYTFKGDSSFAAHYIRLNRYMFSGNRYTLEVSLKTGANWIVKTSNFSFYWRFVPNTSDDLDLALSQMRYIDEADSTDYYEKRSFAEKKGYFVRFWKRMDPVPETEENELMNEYYRRINTANQNFTTSGIDGWKTDRGRIYIKFGPPNDIDRHPFEQGSRPYVVWRYYSLQKIFLFIDRTGFGDYVLHPDYYYVEFE
ncbi:MAG TPA: GWxTD domain-containing protein [Calditrichia bacterium]|nr:GWxTD domain-containing protein [Calditrichia bacterium]